MTEFLPRAERPHYVYRLYDAEDVLLYIGCTEDVETRLYHLTHPCNRGKGPGEGLHRRGVARWTAEEHPNRKAGFAAERAAIRAEKPLLNVQSKARVAA